MDSVDEVVFLTMDQVDRLHQEMIRLYSPGESRAVRDRGLLESALAAPRATWGGEFLYRSLPEMAAAYLISLTQNHAYENGNKRVGFAARSVFLRMNGFRLELTQDEAVRLTLMVATGEVEREQVGQALEQAVVPL